jgi:hypothetical protein
MANDFPTNTAVLFHIYTLFKLLGVRQQAATSQPTVLYKDSKLTKIL